VKVVRFGSAQGKNGPNRYVGCPGNRNELLKGSGRNDPGGDIKPARTNVYGNETV
jgi:hypothetical protein